MLLRLLRGQKRLFLKHDWCRNTPPSAAPGPITLAGSLLLASPEQLTAFDERALRQVNNQIRWFESGRCQKELSRTSATHFAGLGISM